VWTVKGVGVASEQIQRADEVPPPSAELILLRVCIEAFLETSPRRRARAFLDVAASILATEDTLAELMPSRPASEHARLSLARRQALAMFRAYLPTFIARLPTE